MSSTYNSEYPNVPFDNDFVAFFEKFYSISDTKELHKEYTDCFTQKATVVMASKTASGSEEILKLRTSMWEKVQSRRHSPTKVFPYGTNSDEVMLHGTVDYVLLDGKEATVPWAARAHLVKENSGVKMNFYQVYFDTAAQSS